MYTLLYCLDDVTQLPHQVHAYWGPAERGDRTGGLIIAHTPPDAAEIPCPLTGRTAVFCTYTNCHWNYAAAVIVALISHIFVIQLSYLREHCQCGCLFSSIHWLTLVDLVCLNVLPWRNCLDPKFHWTKCVVDRTSDAYSVILGEVLHCFASTFKVQSLFE